MSENRIVAVARKRKSAELLVSFNSYSSMAFCYPDQPYATKLENFASFCALDANVIWFVEEFYSWYTLHEKTVLDVLLDFVAENGIRRVRLTGMSAGGFAAVRFGAILNRMLDQRGLKGVQIDAFGINAQTGFRQELLDRIAQTIAREGWTLTSLGENPPLLEAHQFRADKVHHPECDLQFVVRAHGFGQYRAFLFYDRLNPIDRVFAEDLAAFPQVALMSLGLATDHGSGCTHLSQSAAVKSALAGIFALPPVPPDDAEIRVTQSLLPVSAAHQHGDVGILQHMPGDAAQD